MGRKLNSSLCHRDKERIRHQMLNKSLDLLCSIVPGIKQKETKAFKLKRIMSYVKFLHRKKSLVASSLQLEQKKDGLKSDVNDYIEITQSLKNVELRNSKPCKAEIVFLRKGNQTPCSPNDEKVSSKTLSSHMITQNRNNKTSPSHTEFSNNGEPEDSVFSGSNGNSSYKEGEFFENIEQVQSEDGNMIYSDCAIGCNLSVSSIDLNLNRKENAQQDDTALVRKSAKLHVDVDLGCKKSTKNSLQLQIKEKSTLLSSMSPILTDNQITEPEELNYSLNLNNSHSEDISIIQSESEHNVVKNGFKRSCASYKFNATEVCKRNNSYSLSISEKISSSASKDKIISDLPITEANGEADIFDDQIVPNFVNVLVNFQNKNESNNMVSQNHIGDEPVTSNECTKANDASRTINTEFPFTPMMSQLKHHLSSDTFSAPNEENLTVLTDISNKEKLSATQEHLQHNENEMLAPIAKYSDDSYTINNSNNSLFYKNYIFPHYRIEEAFIHNYPLPPVNPWSSHFGAFMPHAYTENMLYKNMNYNYMNISPMANNVHVFESELSGQNMLLSQARENNYSDVMQDLVDASKRSQNDIPYNASCFPILSDVEIRNDFNTLPEPLSVETSYCAPNLSPPFHSYLVSDKSCEFTNLNNPNLIKDDGRPSFEEEMDLSVILSKEKRYKRRRKEKQSSLTSKRKTTKFTDTVTKNLKDKPKNYARDQVVPGESGNLSSCSTLSKITEKNRGKSKRKSLGNLENFRSDFLNFGDMENCYLSLDEKTAMERYGSNDKYKYSSFNGDSSLFGVSEKKSISTQDSEYQWMYDPPIVIKQEQL